MPIYEVRKNGKTYEVNAPDVEALKAAIPRLPGGDAAPAPSAPPAAPQEPSVFGDVVGGLRSSAARLVYGGGDVIRRATGMERVIDKPDVQAQMTPPDSTAGRVASGAGDLAQFFLPTGVKKYKQAAEAVKSGAITLAQTGSPRQALVSAGTSLVAPALLRSVSSATQKAAVPLVASAEKKVVQALGASKERYKAMAERLAPQILRRGLSGSRDSLLEQAVTKVDDVSAQLDTALTTYGKDVVGVKPVLDVLESAKDAFRTVGQSGQVVEFEPRAIAQLAGLQKTLSDLGSHPTVDQLVAIRRAWDKVVDQAGGFAHRAGGAIGVPLKDQSEAWAKREATGAIRKLLADELPDLATINKEYAFWRSLKDVLTQTQQRTQPQGPGVGKAIATVAGAAAGASGGLSTAIMAGMAGRQIQALVTSPRWRMASARVRNELADALASGIPNRIQTTAARIAASLPVQVAEGSTP